MKRSALVTTLIVLATLAPPQLAQGQGIQMGSFTLQPARPTQQELPDARHRVLRGTDWLGGRGVDVFYKNGSTCDFSCSQTLKPLNTCAFQCVDLAVRLYATVGYPNWSLNGSLISAAYQMRDVAIAQKGDFSDLTFYPNDGTAERPPAPGNLLIFGAAASNGYFGHVAVVNRVFGNYLEFVQQNLCYDGTARLGDYALIKVELVDGKQKFRVSTPDAYSTLLGWIHSKRVKEQLIDQSKMLKLGALSWNRDDTAVYVYLSPESTRRLAAGETDFEARIAAALDRAGALSFTDGEVAHRVIQQIGAWARSDARLSPQQGVRSVDFTLKYTGRMYWVRPWGGPANGKWIPFTAPDMIHTGP
ncbi:CHAP domain-containing protein [Candidatus Roseilinea sp. NK_OTU-006]|jgi:hypothetical protein|nr:CHAP domain-containing protein [Candidatus Roseilinea sp. NK_OTU-006]